jgi:hypothetical protein
MENELTAGDVDEMLRYIPPRPDYATWTRIIAAVGAALPPEEAAVVLNAWSAEERPGEYAVKLRHRLPNVGIGSLVNLAKAGGYDAKEAARRRHGGAGRTRINAQFPAVLTHFTPPPAPSRSRPAVQPRPAATTPAPTAIKWPRDLHAGDAGELRALASVRKIPGVEGLEAATASGHLFFATLPDKDDAGRWIHCPAWLLTDSARRIALARRLDGLNWHHTQQKAWMLRGSQGNWPIGAPDIGDAPTVGLTEGGPDFLCLWHMIALEGEEMMPTCMPSAACNIAPEALPHFYGRDILLFPHYDGEGGAGARTLVHWTRQLRDAGAASVRYFNFANYLDTETRRVFKDLNDFITARAAGRLAPAPPFNPANPSTPNP